MASNAQMDSHQPHPSSLERTLKRVARLYVQRRFDEAYALCRTQLGIFDPLTDSFKARNMLATYFLRVATHRTGGTRESAKLDWDYIVQCCGGSLEYVPADVLCAGILLLQRQRLHTVSRDTIELWLLHKSRNDANNQDDESHNYERLIELYCLHVLPSLGDFDGAKQFLEWNDRLSMQRRALYMEKLVEIQRQYVEAMAPKKDPTNDQRAADQPQKSEKHPHDQVTPSKNTVKTSPPEEPNKASQATLTAFMASEPSQQTIPLPQREMAPKTSKKVSPVIATHMSRLRAYLVTFGGIPLAAFAAFLLYAIARFLKRRYKDTPAGRAIIVLVENLYTTAKMGFNVQSL
ncbi:hypothetical protein BC832DRAFT_617756 [Gaertneriomyces semiglobifer]|nr:hypothetical protein BC832DRAFT_617756 [Gaertneriomyces semiglobifer]